MSIYDIITITKVKGLNPKGDKQKMMQAKIEANDIVKNLYTDNQKGIFNFDYVLQRDGSQWTANQKNALIDTVSCTL